jgi:hypothetical protein
MPACLEKNISVVKTFTKKSGAVVTLYTYIWEVLGLNLRWDTGYPEVFHGFPQSLRLIPE